MTQLIQSPQAWKTIQKSLLGSTLGLVPTLGNLHAGHLSLLARSRKENDLTVASCFLNPTQFNNAHDLQNYPHTLSEDLQLMDQAGVDYCFAPQYSDMYPDHYRYQVSEKVISTLLEGQHRPGHFEGMLTIVLKLFLLIKPQRTYFSEKDYQQLQLVKGLVNSFLLDIDVIACPTIRNEHGLPLSSRNRHLTPEQLALSRYFNQYLCSHRSCQEIAAALRAKGFKVDYVEEHDGRRFAAVQLGTVRLIDNIPVPPPQ